MKELSWKAISKIRTVIEDNIDTYLSEIETESPGVDLPRPRFYDIGFKNPVDLYDYPAILVGLDNRTIPSGYYSDPQKTLSMLTVHILFVLRKYETHKDEIGMKFADALTELCVQHYKWDGLAEDSRVTEISHYAGDDTYFVEVSLEVDIYT